jgi:hypothetical protein
MAYLREETENVEVSFPIKAIWDAIPAAVEKLGWTVEESDEVKHRALVKTKGAFLSYHSILTVNLTVIDEKTTKLTVSGKTPVTTITAMADYGRTSERINVLIESIARIMEPKKFK